MQETASSHFAAHKDEFTGQDRGTELNWSLPSDPVPSPQVMFREISRLQEDVNRLREHLLVERAKLRLTGEAVRKQRFQTSNMEGKLLASLRVFVNDNRIHLPPSIEEAYEKVEQARDSLGTMEDDYLLDERALGAAERLFMQKENTFYQHQLPELFTRIASSFAQQRVQPSNHSHPSPPPPPPPLDPIVLGDGMILVHDAPPPPPPSPPLLSNSTSYGSPEGSPLSTIQRIELNSNPHDVEMQYVLAKAELEDLRKEFDSLRPRQSEMIKHEFDSGRKDFRTPTDYTYSSDFEEKYSEVLSRLSACEVKVQRLHTETAQFRGTPEKLQRRRSAPLQAHKLNHSPLTSMVRAQTVVAPGEYDKIQMESRVREWLLEYSRNNPIERNVYANILKTEGIKISDEDSLKERTEEYWPTGVANRTSILAGDSSVNIFGNSASLICPSQHLASGSSQEISSYKELTLSKRLCAREYYCSESDHNRSPALDHHIHSKSTPENTSLANQDVQNVASLSFSGLVPDPPRTKFPRREGHIFTKGFHHDRCRSATNVPINFRAVSDSIELGPNSNHHQKFFRNNSIATSTFTV